MLIVDRNVATEWGIKRDYGSVLFFLDWGDEEMFAAFSCS